MLRLAVRVRGQDAEVVLAELLELAPGGVEEVALPDGAVEYAVYGAPGELPSLPDLRAAAGGALVEVSTSEIADDWAERWREFHRPLVLPGRLTVRPPWEPAGDTPIDLVIEPGQAFGTGSHATTRMCLELLMSEPVPAGGPFLDLGCGSGVLAIAAARLGFAPSLAFDFDPLAVEATVVNARENGVAVDVRRLDVRDDPLPDIGGATVAANLLGPLLRTLARRLGDAGPGARPRRLIASGLLESEADELSEVFRRQAGLRERERRRCGGWAALALAPAEVG
jgi:ribosomal protein L11 methyltransferase